MWQGIHETHRLLVDNENILEKVHLHRVNFYVKRGHSTGKRYLHVIANDYGLPVSKKEVIYYRHGVLLTIYTQKKWKFTNSPTEEYNVRLSCKICLIKTALSCISYKQVSVFCGVLPEYNSTTNSEISSKH